MKEKKLKKNHYLTIKNLLTTTKDYEHSSTALKKFHPFDIATVFLDLKGEERKNIYTNFPIELIADIFEYLERDYAVEFLKEMDFNKSASILEKMNPDDAADIIKEIEDDSFLESLNKDEYLELNNLSKHLDDTAGAIMTTNYLKVEDTWDVKDAMKYLVSKATTAEVIDPLFVCNNNVLLGILDLKKLIVARSPKKISEIMSDTYEFANIDASITEVSKKIRDYDLVALPVVDNLELVGIITADDALDVIKDETIDDYNKMASMGSASEGRYSIFKSLLSRIPWLVILLFLSIIISNVIGVFDGVIKQVTVLVFFQTLILDMAGNIGTQSLAVTIRNLGKGNLSTLKDTKKHLFKEAKITLFNSVLLGIIAFIVCLIFLAIKQNPGVDIVLVSLVVSLSMVIALIISGFLGVILPLIFSKIKIDPAVASGPFISTLNDLVSVVVYFSLAKILLGLM